MPIVVVCAGAKSILDLRATKDEVLELYLNDVYLGNRGSFAIHGVAEAARLYFGKDVNNLSLGEAAGRSLDSMWVISYSAPASS